MQNPAQTSLPSGQPRAVRDLPDRGSSADAATESSQELVLQYVSLVKAIAWQIYGSLPAHAAVDLSDVIQAGHLGLISATRSYKSDARVPFASYARYRIRGEILDSLRKLDSASRNLRRWQRRIENESRGLTTELQRNPTDEEISERLGVEIDKLRKKRLDLWFSASCSLNQYAAEEENGVSHEWASGRDGMPDTIQERKQMRQFLLSAVEKLPQRSRRVILLYYLQNLTMKEIGHMLKVNESRVSQIHKSALRAMAVRLRSSGIESPADI